MVRLYGPAMSLAASGSLAETIVFSSWKGRSYLRERVIPANPRSGGQVGVRAMFKFLSQIWQELGTGPVASWDSLADQRVISPFNAFMGYNMARWRNFLPPTQAYPAAESASVGTYANEAATAGVRQIDVAIELTAAGNAWGVAIFRATTTGFSTSFANHVASIKTPGLAVVHFIDTPLPPDTYWYNFRGFNSDGILNPEEGEVTATVV